MDSAALEEIRRSQITVAQSQARTEGQVEGIKLAIESINSTLAGVADVRETIAKLEERDRHSDPLIGVMQGQVAAMEVRMRMMEKTESRQWIEGTIRMGIASLGGAGIMEFIRFITR